MKKILSLILVVIFVLGLTTSYADVVYTRDYDARTLTYTLAGTDVATLTGLTTNNRILGVMVSDSSAGAFGVFDYATLAAYNAETSYSGTDIIIEAYCAAGGVSVVMFPLPKNISNGVVAKLSNSTGSGTIFYE